MQTPRNSKLMVRTIQFIFGIILLIALEVSKVYFIMPFPGSQRSESIDFAYFIHNNIFYFRFIGFLIILFPTIYFFMMGKTLSKVLSTLAIIFYAVIAYFVNFKFLADKMFYQPQHKIFASSASSKVSQNDLVIAVSINGKSKAYPIEIIGYHHQVRDTIGGEPVMVTYCTVCRTGRVYKPEVDGKPETFRLVGMDHFNAMFEDAETKSWWRQVSGEAIAGPLTGKSLEEIPSQQMTLRTWLDLHPDSEILQADPSFQKDYDDLAKFDEGTIDSGLERRDSLSWKEKSWVVGVQVGLEARAYDWNELLEKRVVNDVLGKKPLVVFLESDSASFHVFERDTLEFSAHADGVSMTDKQTRSMWNRHGESTEGALRGNKLQVVQSYQEFWHSWKTFHPQTSQHGAAGENQ